MKDLIEDWSNDETRLTKPAILIYLIIGMLPYSKKGESLTIEQVMTFAGIVNNDIPKEDVIGVLASPFYSCLFYKVNYENNERITDHRYRIDHHWFFTTEQRGDPNWGNDLKLT